MHYTKFFNKNPTKKAIIAATPPITKVSKEDLMRFFLDMLPLIEPMINNATPVKMNDNKNLLFSIVREIGEITKDKSGMKPIIKNEIKVANAVLLGSFL